MAAAASELGRYLKRAVIVTGAVLCLFAVAAAVWARAGRRTYRAVYRLGGPDGQGGEAHLQRTAQVFSARLGELRREFRLGSCAVRPLPPDRVEVQMTSGGDPLGPLAWLAMQGKAEFRLLHPQDDILDRAGPQGLPPEYEVKAYREQRFVLARPGEMETVEYRYAVQREPLLVVTEFRRVTMETVGAHKMVVVTFHFTGDDARAFGELTALHAGRKMAMLIDGEMFFPPREIESSVTGGSVQAQGYFQIPPMRRLARMLDCGSLPVPVEQETLGVQPR